MLIFWILFLALVFIFLLLDLGIFHRKDSVIGFREAINWTLVWVALSLLFSAAVFLIYENNFQQGITTTSGTNAIASYLTAYVIEKSLSLDNIFIFAALFSYFKIPPKLQHRLLFWGVFGAILLRGLFIWAGVNLLQRASWALYIFGFVLLASSWKMLKENSREINPWIKKLVKKFPRGNNVRGRFVCALITIEITDAVFALDSVPAIFSITQDPFIIFTSNIMAILGLRSLYFALASLLSKFRYLDKSIAIILGFTGTKILLERFVHISALASLAIILVIFATGVLLSIKKSPT